MPDADALLAEYSRLSGQVACLEHSLRDVGEKLPCLGGGLTSSPVAVAAAPGRFRLDSTDYLSVTDVEDALRQLEDLGAGRRKVAELQRTLARTEHAHMVR